MLGEREQGVACLGGKWHCILRVEIVWNMGNNPQIFEVEVLPGPVSEQSVRNGTAIRDPYAVRSVRALWVVGGYWVTFLTFYIVQRAIILILFPVLGSTGRRAHSPPPPAEVTSHALCAVKLTRNAVTSSPLASSL